MFIELTDSRIEQKIVINRNHIVTVWNHEVC